MNPRKLGFTFYNMLLFVLIVLSTIGCIQDDKAKSSRPTINNIILNPEPTATACVPGNGCDTRPDLDIQASGNVCVCQNGQTINIGNCSALCAGATSASNPTLFMNFKVGTLVAGLDFTNAGTIFKLANTQNWCNQAIDDGNANPGCKIVISDGINSAIQSDVVFGATGNSITSVVSTLSQGVAYVAHLEEISSGAKTSSFQIYLPKPNSFVQSGPLKINPIDEYACITKTGTPGATQNLNKYDNAVRLHFYFKKGQTPDILPSTANGYLICHDDLISGQGKEDKKGYLRLELQEHIFNLWDQSDSRFSDANNNSKLDINDQIQTRLEEEYGVTSDINIFSTMTWPDQPQLSDGSNAQVATPTLGVIMQAFIDSDPQRGAFCPTGKDFHGTQNIFKILGDYIPDTEGIFLAVRDPVVVTDANGADVTLPRDFILIRESLLKQIWFYFDGNGTATLPNDETAATEVINFYWPPQFNSSGDLISNPFLKQSQQIIYTIKHPTQIQLTTGASPGSLSNIPPDKRFGCVPITSKILTQ